MTWHDDATSLRRMLEDIVVTAVPNNPSLLLQPGNNGAPVRIERRFGHECRRLCAIICAFTDDLVNSSSYKKLRDRYVSVNFFITGAKLMAPGLRAAKSGFGRAGCHCAPSGF